MFGFTVPTIIASLVLLLVRIIITIAFVAEARYKLKDIKTFSKNDGLPLPVACFVAIAELCAALGMLTGILAQWAGVGIILLMLATMGMHIIKWHSPYWATKRGWEYDLIMLAFAAVIVAYGPGQFAL